MMVLANYLRQNLLEPLKERQRREGFEQGWREGFAIGRAEAHAKRFAIGYAEGIAIGYAKGIALGRSESDAEWRAWNERREKAAALGEPFDEPPPNFDA